MTAFAYPHHEGGPGTRTARVDLLALIPTAHTPSSSTGGPRLPWLPGRTESHRADSRPSRAVAAGPRSLGALKQTARRALVLLLFANFVGYATIGSNGILRWSGYHSQKDERIGELALLDAELARLAHHNDLLDPMSADPDLVEEMIRTQLGLVRPDEVIILTR